MDGLVDVLRINEIDEDVFNFWHIVKNNSDELCNLIKDFEIDEDNARGVINQWKLRANIEALSDVDKAFLTLLRNRLARNGVMTPRSGLLKKGDVKGLFSRWYPQTLIDRIQRINSFSDAIEITQMDGMEFIQRYSNPQASYFIDPPYTKAGRHLYKHNKIDNQEIFEFANKHGAEVLITYDKSLVIEEYVKKYSLCSIEMEMMGGTNNKKYELLISRNLDWIGGYHDW